MFTKDNKPEDNNFTCVDCNPCEHKDSCYFAQGGLHNGFNSEGYPFLTNGYPRRVYQKDPSMAQKSRINPSGFPVQRPHGISQALGASLQYPYTPP